ncbi:MAG: ATPase [Solirubrobacterales bacterium]|nr:ATPase [Solirubrobacterales bacterium]
MRAAAHARVVLDDRVDRTAVEMLLSSSPQLGVLDYLDLREVEHANGDAGDALIVACASFTPAIGEYVRAARRLYPGRPVLLVCTSETNGYVSEAIESGVDDIVTLPPDADPRVAQAMSRQLVFTLEKAMARRRDERTITGQKLGRMICVLGLKGGGGKTLTASNLAASLADAGHSVALVDLDLQFGDVGLTLSMSPERTLYDLVRSGGSLDAEKLEDFLTVHPSGVRALLAPARPDQAGVVTADFLKDVYPLLRAMHEFVIVDTPPSFTPEVIGAVDASTEICIVAMLDALSLKNSKLGLETLELMDYSGRVRFVLNRADSNVGISRQDVVGVMGRTPDVLVPSDRNITRSVNQGEPIVLLHRRSEAARAFNALADLYIADQGPAADGGAPQRRRRLFRRGR